MDRAVSWVEGVCVCVEGVWGRQVRGVGDRGRENGKASALFSRGQDCVRNISRQMMLDAILRQCFRAPGVE